MGKDEIDRMRRVSERFMPPAVLLRYAVAAGLNGQPSEAQRSLRLACHMWPKRNCEQARESWTSLQARFPSLQAIKFPVEGEGISVATPHDLGTGRTAAQ